MANLVIHYGTIHVKALILQEATQKSASFGLPQTSYKSIRTSLPFRYFYYIRTVLHVRFTFLINDHTAAALRDELIKYRMTAFKQIVTNQSCLTTPCSSE